MEMLAGVAGVSIIGLAVGCDGDGVDVFVLKGKERVLQLQANITNIMSMAEKTAFGFILG